jgi:hypothetical protein
MEDKKQKKMLKFEEIRQEILDELNKRNKCIGISEPVTLVDGFVNHPVNMELTSSLMLGGATIPMIMLLGTQSGIIYLFALKALLKLEDF